MQNGTIGVTYDMTAGMNGADPQRTGARHLKTAADSQRTAATHAKIDPDSTRICGSMTTWITQMCDRTSSTWRRIRMIRVPLRTRSLPKCGKGTENQMQ